MKHLKKFISLFLLTIMLTGCVRLQADFNVDKKGNITGTLKYLVSEDLISYAQTSKDEVIKSLKKEFNSSDVKEITEKIDNKNYYGIEANSKDISNLKATVKDGKVTLTFPLKELLSNSTSGSDYNTYKSYLKTAKQAGASAVINITMPGKPTTNVGKVNGNKVTIDLIDVMNDNKNITDVTITSSTGDSYTNYIIAGVVILVTAGALYFYFKKKKSTEA